MTQMGFFDVENPYAALEAKNDRCAFHIWDPI